MLAYRVVQILGHTTRSTLSFRLYTFFDAHMLTQNRHSRLIFILLAVFALIFSACDNQDAIGPAVDEAQEQGLSKKGNGDEAARAMMATINKALIEMDVDYRVEVVEWITTGDGPEFGRTVFASNRGNKQLLSRA